MLPLISVIVPVYNVEPYLKSCLDSVLNQTYTNIEIIIVASTSQDLSCEICNEYAKIDSRVLVIHSDPNGLSDARNKGIDVAKGNYLSFIDSDDCVHPDFIKTLYSLCVEYNLDIAQCNYYDFYDTIPDFILQDHSDISIYTGVEMCYNLYNNLYIQSVVSWSKLYRKELFRDVRFPFKKIHEDTATSHRLFYNANNVGVTSQRLYYYRQRSDSIMGRNFSLKNLDYLEALDERLSFFKEIGNQKLCALTLKVYAEAFPNYIYNVKQLNGDNGLILNNLSNRYKRVKQDVIKCPFISFREKIHLILVWLYPRTPCTMRLLGIIRR